MIRRALLAVVFASLLLARSTKSTISVSAVVRPAARIEVLAPGSAQIGVTMYPNAQALVWTAAGSCGEPVNPQVIASSGISQLSFDPQGKDRLCLITTDGILKTSAGF